MASKSLEKDLHRLLQKKLCPLPRVLTTPLAATHYQQYGAVLQVVDERDIASTKLPFANVFAAAAKKQHDKVHLIMLPDGTRVVRCVLKESDSHFAMMELLRRRITPLLSSKTLAIDIRTQNACMATVSSYTAQVVAAKLPSDVLTDSPNDSKSDSKNNSNVLKNKSKKPPQLIIAGGAGDHVASNAAAEANTLSRVLCRTPPNILTVPAFAQVANDMAKRYGLKVRIYHANELQKMGAGAMLAVGAASPLAHQPCIVHLSYVPKIKLLKSHSKSKNIPRASLIGKGVCYDTGGVNIKPAKYMRGMKGDMAGAAAALAAVTMAAKTKLQVQVDAYLALAENSAGTHSYRPDEVVCALNGKRIEVVHSDAEGRMILADTLALAAKNINYKIKDNAPHIAVSMATLTGTMQAALGRRMSGFFASFAGLQKVAQAAAATSGERLCYFPMPPDYVRQLKSDVADIKQCLEDGDADHIYAALFLREFIGADTPWLHLDLSSAKCEGGLAATPGPETGAGANWALALLHHLAEIGCDGVRHCLHDNDS